MQGTNEGLEGLSTIMLASIIKQAYLFSKNPSRSSLKTPNFKLKTQNSKPKTQNSKPKTQNSKPKTQNAKPKTQNVITCRGIA
jgi:hypothetical protein